MLMTGKDPPEFAKRIDALTQVFKKAARLDWEAQPLTPEKSVELVLGVIPGIFIYWVLLCRKLAPLQNMGFLGLLVTHHKTVTVLYMGIDQYQ